ncbi:PAS domain S-box protein [Marinilabiliaceae bacterium JC040]|nr:PAS domain S-box protein [Marinilabiliaceae bacterium JC040]
MDICYNELKDFTQEKINLCSWQYDLIEDKVIFSKEVYEHYPEIEVKDHYRISDLLKYVKEDLSTEVINIISSKFSVDVSDYSFTCRLSDEYFDNKYVLIHVSRKVFNSKPIFVGNILDVTPLLKGCSQMRELENELSLVLSTARFNSFEYNVKENKLRFRRYNKSVLGLDTQTDYKLDVILDKIHDEDKDRFLEILNKCLEGRLNTGRADYRLMKPDGNIAWVNTFCNVTEKDSEGKAIKLIGVTYDITKEIISQLRTSNKKRVYNHLVPNSKLFQWRVDHKTNQHYWSDELFTFLGLNKEETSVCLETFVELIDTRNKSKISNLILSVINGEQNFLTTKIKVSEDRIKCIEIIGFPKFDSEGNILETVGYIRDITEEYSLLIDSDEIKDDYRRIQESLELGSWRYIIDKDILLWSDGMYKLFGYDVNSVLPNEQLLEYHIFEEDYRKFKNLLEDIHDLKTYKIELRVFANDGQIRILETFIKATKDKDGKIIEFVGDVKDITKQRKLEKKQKLELVRLKKVAEDSQMGYFEYFGDTQKIVLYKWGINHIDTRNVERDNSINTLLKFLDKPEAEKVKYFLRLIQKKASVESVIFKVRDTEGEDRWLLAKGQCHFKDYRIIKVYGFIQDITEIYNENKALTEAREKAEKSFKLKTMFLSSISHEVRTPMNSIMGFANLLDDASYSMEEKKVFINKIHKNSIYLFKLINDIMDISRLEAKEVEKCETRFSLNDFLSKENFEEIIEKDGINFSISKLDKDIRIKTDRNKLIIILNKLLSNAFKYTTKGDITLGATLGTDDIITIFVEDTGCGISNNFIQDIYKTFTKDNRLRDGIGLGLSICKRYCDLLGIEITVDSIVNKGSKFSLKIKVN